MKFKDIDFKKWIPCIIPCFVILSLSVLGAALQNNLFIFVMIAVICVLLGLVSFNKVREEYYPCLIGSVGLALLLQSSLLGSGLVGSDVHTEYYFYNQALGGWDYTNPHPYNSAAGATVLAPFLTNVFHIPGIWIFKLLFPMIFSIVPVLLYFVFRKEFGSKIAFLSSMFFVIIPTWSMELIGIPRQMLGEVMLALCLFVVIVTKWKLRVKVPLLIVFGLIGATFHYIMGPVIIFYLGVGSFFLLFFKRRTLSIRWMSLVLVTLVTGNILYYGWVAQGMPLTCLKTGSDIVVSLVVRRLPESFSNLTPDIQIPGYPYMTPESSTDEQNAESEKERSDTTDDMLGLILGDTPAAVDAVTKIDKTESTNNFLGFITDTDPITKAAWGGDFLSVGIWGKLFRIFQYATQLCVIVGAIWLFRNRKKHSPEYLSFCGAAVVLLGAAMFLPHLAAMINASRVYHIASFLLAPLCIVGGKVIFRNFKVLTLCLLIPYFIFTSGAVFELTKQADISRIELPYAVSLSNHRVDVVGVFTDNDVKVRDWAVENNLVVDMYADTHSQLLLWEKSYTYWRDLRRALKSGEFGTANYIFFSERNNTSKTIILRPSAKDGVTSGVRVVIPYEEMGIDKVIESGNIVYQQGDAFILEVNRDDSN